MVVKQLRLFLYQELLLFTFPDTFLRFASRLRDASRSHSLQQYLFDILDAINSAPHVKHFFNIFIFWHIKIVHFLCSNFQVFAGIFTRCPTCQRAHIYHFCSFCIRCHICHFPIAIWSQNLGIGTIFEPNLPLKTGCNKFQMESVKMKKPPKWWLSDS